MSEGELLTGDGVTQGIVRIGDTVRRPLRPFSLTVQAYLAHLRDAGFTGAPLPFGVDEQGREVLSFVPGDVPRNPLPPETAGDEVLVALARLIRALHEASAGRGYRRPVRSGSDAGEHGTRPRRCPHRAGHPLRLHPWQRGLPPRVGQLRSSTLTLPLDYPALRPRERGCTGTAAPSAATGRRASPAA